ncbi:hypothetical protein ACIBH1_05625 [Nonomuraea sp. NPDC050663]|uniref:hypothetical protein n=1 Tax=Nonomuraea sp. NPDC050663 TaxID=3364370 RepID=UPI0037ACA22E
MEPVLGWPSGSLEVLMRGEDPPSVLPVDVLAMYWGAVGDRLDDPWVGEVSVRSTEKMKSIIKSASPDGILNAEARIAVADAVDGLSDLIDTSQIEAAQEALSDWFRAQQPLPRLSIQQIRRLSAGDIISHELFGLGRIVRIDGLADKTKIIVDFASKKKYTTLLARYAPIMVLRTADDPLVDPTKKVAESLVSEQPGSELPNLSPELRNLLSLGQVIDYVIADPNAAPNISVVTLLVRKNTDQLGLGDRQYVGQAMKALGAEDGHVLRPSDGAIIRIKVTPKSDSLFPEEPPF